MMLRAFLKQYVGNSESIAIILSLIAVLLAGVIAGPIMSPFVISAVIAYLLHFPINALTKYVSHLSATIIILSASLVAFITSCLWLIPLLSLQLFNFMIEIPKISQQLTVNLFHFLDDYPQIISVEARESLVAQASFEKHTQKILEISATWLMTIIPSALTVIVYLVMIPTIVFFMNKDHLYFFNIIRTFYPEKCPQLTVIWHRIKDELELFVAAKIAHMIIIWALSLALFLMFSLHYAYLLSIPMALTVFIPYVGTAIATIPLVLIAYLQFGFDYQFIALMSSYAALQALEANIIVPILFGQANDMHPIVILGAVLFFGEWFGVSGMFFAIPAAAIIKVLYQYWPKTFEEIVH